MVKFKELNDSLESLSIKVSNVRERSERFVKLIQERTIEIKHLVLLQGFDSISEEIQFFKDIKPQLLAHKIVNSFILDIEIRKNGLSVEDFDQLKKRKLSFIQDHFIDYKEFYFYLQSQSNTRDNMYFTKEHTQNDLFMNIILELDSEFSTGYDVIAGYILAYDLLKNYFKDEQSIEKAAPNSELKWTGSKVALVELLYALNEVGVINMGKNELQVLSFHLGKLLGIELKDIYRTFIEIKDRKKDRCRFLLSLIEALESKMDDFDH
jgi:hypothetical protein